MMQFAKEVHLTFFFLGTVMFHGVCYFSLNIQVLGKKATMSNKKTWLCFSLKSMAEVPDCLKQCNVGP